MNGHDYPELFDPTDDERQAAEADEELWASIAAQADEQLVTDDDGSEGVNIPRAAYTRMVSQLAGLGGGGRVVHCRMG